MSEQLTPVRPFFPHTRIAKTQHLGRRSVEHKQAVARKIDRFTPHIEELLCAQIFLKTGESMSVARLKSRSNAWGVSRLRARGWWVLHNHPDADLSYASIGRAWDRDHTTIIHGVERIRWLILDGRGDAELQALQWLCDQLARRGFTPIKAEDFI